jgi:hypothetical protein
MLDIHRVSPVVECVTWLSMLARSRLVALRITTGFEELVKARRVICEDVPGPGAVTWVTGMTPATFGG